MLSLHPLWTARRRGLLAAAIASAAALVPQASCAHLQPESNTGSGSTSSDSCPAGASNTYAPPASTDTIIVLDGGVPDAMAATACGDSTEQLSHTPGLGADGTPIDISQATGYTPDPTIPQQAATLLGSSTTAETIQMMGPPSVSGGMTNFGDIYRTLDDTADGIRGTYFRDGPRGVDLESPVYVGAFGSPAINYGPNYATVFPVTMTHGATWDLDLEAQIGSDLADEVLASGNSETISPCVNLLRHPAWGRAQETYGEDSFAVGRMATAYVGGAQSYIPACVKHLAAYNIEDQRFSNISVMDSQTLHEIYGRHFEMIVQEGGVACVMASYNSIQLTDGPDTNTYKDTQNPVLLNGMLRGTFGFKGYVMSDFWAMPNGQTLGLQQATYDSAGAGGIAAGLDMEMPWKLNFQDIGNGTLATPQQLQTAATRIVEQKLRFKVAATSGPAGLKTPVTSFGTSGVECNNGHLADAELQAEEGIVLLKNDKNTLPIPRKPGTTIAVLGEVVPYTLVTAPPGTVNFATDPRTGDLGSSRVANDPAKSIGPFAGIQAAANVGLADGGNPINVITGSDANLADNADFVVVVVGLTPADEGEEYTGAGDRVDSTGQPNLHLDPKSSSPTQDQLVMDVAAKGKPMVVVVEAGSGIDMPWLASVPAVVMAWYPGQWGGQALARLLFGDVNFSGKLPITWPVSEADLPTFNAAGSTTAGGTTKMDYYLGYRYYDAVAAGRIAGVSNIQPQFALGDGLSYTTFKYEFMNVPCSTVTSHGVVDVQVAVTNTGTVPGNEVSFLFASYPQTTARRSVKELKGFHRSSLIQPGQTVMFKIPLRIQDLKYWNTAANQWTVESGP
ncbi:MAG TPA: glycoside hydrolase family 3 C-terminal domain-containing protein, partial [Polyangiaceae bacterium]|nr:glycoside hydrolase family 3 C-terminal domain-containing protein [Polyangiaceae bacterium]